MLLRLRHGAEPEPLADTIKTLKSKWPRLAARAETDSAQSQTDSAKLETRAISAELRELNEKARCQEQQTRAEVPQTRAEMPQTEQKKPQTRAEIPLSERLFSLFGGGDSPTLRRSLYFRIQLTCQTFGDPALVVVREVCEAARRARNPGNYFAFSIVRRLRENGFIQEV